MSLELCKVKQRIKSKGYEGDTNRNGSSNWTRTSDIRINSPPFYRLNYGGTSLSGVYHIVSDLICQRAIDDICLSA